MRGTQNRSSWHYNHKTERIEPESRGLRKQIEEDAEELFFCLEEFAEVHNLGNPGVPVSLIVDDDLLTERNLSQAQGLSGGQKLLFVRRRELEALDIPLNIGSPLFFDGVQYQIEDIKGDVIAEITISREVGY